MNEKNWEEILKKSAEQEEIPDSLKPENMKRFLEKNAGNKKKNYRGRCGIIAAAAGLVLVLYAGRDTGILQPDIEKDIAKISKEESGKIKGEALEESAKTPVEKYSTTYEELYRFFMKREREQAEMYEDIRNEVAESEKESVQSSESASPEKDSQKNAHADTNKQEEGVDEADIVKNDGRYLYRIITTNSNDYTQAVQITDTVGGLKEIARIENFDNIFNMYIWENTLVVMEAGWAEEAEPMEYKTASDKQACIDIARGRDFQKIYIYNIEDRAQPKELHTFTIGGSYLDSRLTEGYLYYFVSSGVDKLDGVDKHKQYIPVLEGQAMEASKVYLPEDADTSNYMVLVSVDLRNPTEFKDTRAVVSPADRVYVTENNIYLADSAYADTIEENGRHYNKTKLIRFSYQKGFMKKEAEGEVKGNLLDDMAINESDGYLRMAVTVESYKRKAVKDDVFGKVLGYETTDDRRDNSLYVLDKNLKLVGKLEGLAEDERIYSARFMGDIGYFVTFRQVDPLFSVDLADPENPKILGELKISGFSEYLHFYSENLLLGIGMEADEDTGRTEGMKLSMFDISNPAEVTEQDKYKLPEYSYSEGLYNYKAVMIDTEKNLFGFFAEGWSEGENKENYLLFSYENGAFHQKMQIDCTREKNGIYADVRGTYIGDVFYLTYSDGRMESYSLTDGRLLETL